MASADPPEDETSQKAIRLHHGTDEASANDLFQNGVDQQHAAVWNGSGEFWATVDHVRAEWFARSHPSGPPAACFEFNLAESVILAMLHMNPPGLIQNGPDDYEFLPASHAALNLHMTIIQVVAVP